MEFSSVPDVCAFASERGFVMVNLETGEANASYLFVRKESLKLHGFEEYSYHPPQLLDACENIPPDVPFFIFGTSAGSRVLAQALKDKNRQVTSFIGLDDTTVFDGVMVVAFEEFVSKNLPNTLVLLPNKYVMQNTEKLVQRGFVNILNAHYLVQSLAGQSRYKKYLR